MCLSIVVDKPSLLLARGVHLGFEYMVTHNDIGNRCGYVKVEPGHPWHGLDEEAVRTAEDDHPEVHGGLTFSGPDKPCDKGGEDAGWWLGFDCAHCWDAKDFTLPMSESIKALYASCGNPGHVWTTVEVEAECLRLAKQAADAGRARADQVSRRLPDNEVTK
jgi:hypothetical protein